MDETKEKYPSTFTIENFSSTATLANNDQIKIPVSSTDKIGEKEYNPYEHRMLEHPNTFSGALIHLLKSSLGTGILAIPRAFKNAGLLVGLIGTILIGFICTHTIHILVVASQEMCKKSKIPSLGFAETAEEVFKNGPKGLRNWSRAAKNFVEIALVLTYFVGNAVYVVFITESITKLLAFFYKDAESWYPYFIVCIMVLLILCCQIRELKHLVPFSFIANTTMIIAFGITLYYIFYGIKEVKLSDTKLANDISGIPSFFATVIFAMEGIGTIMPVENSLTKSQFVGCPGVLNIAMIMVVSLYTSIGFFGYLRYGDGTEATITKNLPSEEIPAQVVQVSISLAVFFTFMLQFYVPIDITWRRIKDRIPEKRHNISQILLRTGAVIFVTGIAASAGHHLDALIDLVGAIFLSTLGLLVPAFIDIIMNWRNWGLLNWILYKNILIMGMSLFGLLSGSYYAILNMTTS
ncbi:proton-coupled amino acid transporter-like protein pathetic isoform X2 [Anoplophora glabripennis]|nr:proton-coupled amino acid transporter-like protein pathetic isoform X2 [Anoplophora glabripennis]XP_018577493.1 proton-coupled amino acid transporter-like protein pathetic isoform X2 [Anoplophora glabripennis]